MSEDQDTGSLLAKIGEYEEELSQNPASKVFVHLAEAYRKMDLLDEAAGAIEKGLSQHQEMIPAYICQGRIRTQQGDLEGAAYSFNEALRREAQNIYALQGLARVHLDLEAPQKAIPLVKQLMRLRPDDPETLKLKKECEVQVAATRQGQGKASGAPIKTATMVDIYIKQGLLNDALALCDEILKDSPDNPAILAKKEQVVALLAASSETDLVEPVATDHGTSSETKTLSYVDILEAWLSAINKRRTHV